MIKRNPQFPSLSRQCQILNISRSSFYYRPVGDRPETLDLMRQIDELFTAHPFYGSRQMKRTLALQGQRVGRHRIRRLMRRMGLSAIYQKPNTSKPHPQHRIYPYLLRNLSITKANHVWCTDVTYIPVKGGFFYLVAVMDWATRKVLSWRISNTLSADFCVDALQEALREYGAPQIFNTDQGSQFTSYAFTDVLIKSGIKISMDGKGRCMDNIFIERLWRSLKYECVYLNEIRDGFEAKRLIGDWIKFYNDERPHSSLADNTPKIAYEKSEKSVPPSPPIRLDGLRAFEVAQIAERDRVKDKAA